MSTDYSHFDQLAFDRLFAHGPDGRETLIINSSGIFVGVSISGALSVSQLTVNSVIIGSAAGTVTHVRTLSSTGTLLITSGTSFINMGTSELDVGGMKIGDAPHRINKVNSIITTSTLAITGSVTISGMLGVGATAPASQYFTVSGTTASGVDQVGIAVSPTFSTAATNSVTGVGVAMTTTNAITTQYAINFESNVLSATGHISTAIGIYAHRLTTAANNASGIADNVGFTGNWFINQSATDPSRFSGRIGIGQNPLTSQYLGIGGSTITVTADQSGIALTPVFSSAATSSVTGLAIAMTTANSTASSFAINIESNVVGIGSGGSVTRNIGLYAHQLTNAANNVSGISDNLVFSGNWFINQSATDPSTFGGALTAAKGTFNSVQIGSAANTVAHVNTLKSSATLTFKGTGLAVSGTLSVSGSISGLPPASTAATGVVNTLTQTFHGNKSFQCNASGSFRVLGSDNVILIKADDSTDAITLGASGSLAVTNLNNTLATNGAQAATLLNLPAAATSGNPFGWLTIKVNGTNSYIPFWH